jgi:hypothetical protein
VYDAVENESNDDLNSIYTDNDIRGPAVTYKALLETITRSLESVKEYVEKDPDLFIIMM